jgi:hypothetical protein
MYKEKILCSAPPNRCRDTQHPTWRLKRGRVFNGNQDVGRLPGEAKACTPPDVMLSI